MESKMHLNDSKNSVDSDSNVEISNDLKLLELKDNFESNQSINLQLLKNELSSCSDDFHSVMSESDLYLNDSDSSKIDFDPYPFVNIDKFQKLEKYDNQKLFETFKILEKSTKKIFSAKSFIFKQNDLLNHISLRNIVEKMAQINHPSIVKFVGYSPFNLNKEPKPLIVTDFPSNGSLRDILEKERKGQHISEWNWTRKIITIYGVASGMNYLHSHGIIYGKLCPENILFDDDFFPKINNLEFCLDLTKEKNNINREQLPLTYIPPETFENDEYTKSSEIYSFSMLIYAIITNEEPFHEQKHDHDYDNYNDNYNYNDSYNDNEIKRLVIKEHARPILKSNIPKPYQSLIQRCWSENPTERPTFEMIIKSLKSDSKFIINEIDKQYYMKYIRLIDSVVKISSKDDISKGIIDITKFKKLNNIGYGSFGNVYKVKDINSEKIYAAKVCNKTIKHLSSDQIMDLKREIKILSRLNHQAILKFYGYSPFNNKNKPKPTIIIEYGSISLEQVLKMESFSNAPKGWDFTKKLIVIYGIASGMKYLHSLNIIHRDLKPSNIILNEYLFPKISDFGLSKIIYQNDEMNKSRDAFKGTPAYIAPEIWNHNIYSKEGDVYSFGLIVYEIMMGVTPFNGNSFVQIINSVTSGYRPEFLYHIPDCYKKLIEACWSQDMYKRPSFAKITEYLVKNESFHKDIDFVEFENYLEFVEGRFPGDISEMFVKLDESFNSYEKIKYLELSETVKIIDLKKYDKKNKLGSGAYGNVYKIIDKKTKEEFAAKILKFEFNFLKEIDQIYFSREVNIMSFLKHEAIIKFFGFSQVNFKGKAKPTYVMEIAKNESLEKVLYLERQCSRIPEWNNTKKFINIYGIACVLKYMHSKNIIHRDLKPGNIILDEYLYPKIIDFGFAKDISQYNVNVKSNALGTPAYISPETWNTNKHSKASDVYSFAIILYEILTNEIPFPNSNKYQIIMQVVYQNARPSFNKQIPECYKNLIELCWSKKPEERPTFDDIVELLKTNRNFFFDDVDLNEFLAYTELIGDDFVERNSLSRSQRKSCRSIEKVYLPLSDEKITENTITIFNSIIKEELKNDENNKLDLKNYQQHEILKKGEFNKIYKVKEKKSGKIYAARISDIDMNRFSKEEIRKICCEVNKMTHLKHHSILQFIGFSPSNFKNESKPVFITEMTSKITLEDIISIERQSISFSGWNETKKLICIYGIASGIKYLHSHGILHCNLIPSSILLDSSLHPKLSDFGICSHLLIMNSITFQSVSNVQSSSYYQAPEIFRSEEYMKASDVYSFSLIVYEIITGEKPMFEFKDYSTLYKEVVNNEYRPKFAKPIAECYRKLIEKCWCQDQNERLTFNDIVNILQNDQSFITPKVNRKEYLKYIEKVKT